MNTPYRDDVYIVLTRGLGMKKGNDVNILIFLMIIHIFLQQIITGEIEKANFRTEKYTKHILVFKFLLLLQHE